MLRLRANDKISHGIQFHQTCHATWYDLGMRGDGGCFAFFFCHTGDGVVARAERHVGHGLGKAIDAIHHGRFILAQDIKPRVKGNNFNFVHFACLAHRAGEIGGNVQRLLIGSISIIANLDGKFLTPSSSALAIAPAPAKVAARASVAKVRLVNVIFSSCCVKKLCVTLPALSNHDWTKQVFFNTLAA